MGLDDHLSVIKCNIHFIKAYYVKVYYSITTTKWFEQKKTEIKLERLLGDPDSFKPITDVTRNPGIMFEGGCGCCWSLDQIEL